MFKNVDLFFRRATQVSTAFMVFVATQNFFHFPHAVWIMATGAMVYGSFHSGSVIKRAYLRFWGTVGGIGGVVIVWHILHFNYRLSFWLLAFFMWTSVFLLCLSYDRWIILLTMFSDFLLQSFNQEDFNLQYYIFDRFTCTLAAFCICIVLEYFCFARANLSYLSYQDLKGKILKDISFLHGHEKTLPVSRVVELIQSLMAELEKLTGLIQDMTYEGWQKFQFSTEEYHFNEEIKQLFRKVVSIHYLKENPSPTSSTQLSELNRQIDETFKTL